MYRSVISLLILTSLVGTLIAINPQARQEATLLWEEARPTLVGWRDRTFEVFRTLLSGDPDAQIEHEPVLPEQNIEFIITLNTIESSQSVVRNAVL